MNGRNPTLIQIVSQHLGGQPHSEVVELINWLKAYSDRVDPVKIAEAARMDFNQRQWVEKRRLAETLNDALVAKLKRVITPGMRLKMKGCKDGNGIREFIRWEKDNLVCWQLKNTYEFDHSTGKTEKIWKNTNQVTTHMADKVAKLYIGHGGNSPVSVKSFFN